MRAHPWAEANAEAVRRRAWMREVRARLAASRVAGGPEPITEVGLPERTVRALVAAGIEDVDALVARGLTALARTRRLGMQGATAVREMLDARGLVVTDGADV